MKSKSDRPPPQRQAPLCALAATILRRARLRSGGSCAYFGGVDRGDCGACGCCWMRECGYMEEMGLGGIVGGASGGSGGRRLLCLRG